MSTWLKNAFAVVVISFIGWTSVGSLFSFPHLVSSSLAQSTKPEREAVSVSDLLRGAISVSRDTTVLYLNGNDGGDNYYRVRYLMYPIHFIDYWSWSHPNAGGRVWDRPRFSTQGPLKHILLKYHVDYVFAIHRPLMLRLVGLDKPGMFLFRVNRQELLKTGVLRDSLMLAVRWP